jgi:hypothetical protein
VKKCPVRAAKPSRRTHQPRPQVLGRDDAARRGETAGTVSAVPVGVQGRAAPVQRKRRGLHRVAGGSGNLWRIRNVVHGKSVGLDVHPA